MAKKNDDYVTMLLEKLGIIFLQMMKYLLVKLIKALTHTSKAFIKEVLEIRLVLKYRNRTIIFILSTTIVLILIIAYGDIKYSWLSIFSYFLIVAVIKEIKEYARRCRTASRIRKLNKKYKEIVSLFDGAIDVTNENPITFFSRTKTISDYEKQKQRIENFFNRHIVLFRKCNNFRYTEIIFHIETKFKRYYKFQDYINFINLQKISHMYLPVLIGMNEYENLLIKDLAEIKHLFINGESGGGKSSMINCIIQSLMVLRSNIIYILIDLKGGAELSDYKDFKNIIVIHEIANLYKMVKTLEKIMDNRLSLIRNTRRCKDINGYMSQTNKKLNSVVMVIDEIASIRLSGFSNYKNLENTLLQILQKGRVCNIHIIGATQKPSGEQINTNVRAGFLQNISFKVADRYTQQQTKVIGTENLKTGEWKSTFTGDNIYKGFLIRDNADKIRKLPKCNDVFEALEHKLIFNKFFIQIKEKHTKINKRFWNNIKGIVNKTSQDNLSDLINYKYIIKDIPNAVIDDITELKKLSKIADISIETYSDLHTDNYQNYLKFIFVNNKAGKLPSTLEQENALSISKTKRVEYLNRAYNEEMLNKCNGRSFIINFENNRWNKFKEVANDNKK